MSFALKDWWLTWALKARSAEIRRRAVERLEGRTDAAALALLQRAVQDPDAAVRRSAVAALGRFKEEEAIALLVRCLRDPDEQVQETAVAALRHTESRSVLPALVGLLGQGSARLQYRLAQTLQMLGWRPAGPEEEALYAVANGDYDRAAAIGGPAIPLLARRLRQGDYAERQAVVRALTRASDPGVPRLLTEALRDMDATVRTAAADGLAALGAKEAVPPLIRALKDPVHTVRAAAAAALGQLQDLQAVQPLIAALEDPQWEVRVAALEALGRLGDRRAFSSVAACLEDSEEEVRQQAAETLGVVGDASVVEKLIRTLLDPHAGVRQAAARALHRIDPCWQRSQQAQELLPVVEAALQSREAGVRLAAANLIRQITGLSPAELAQQRSPVHLAQRHVMAAQTLESLAQDADPDVRLAAVQTLGRLRLSRSLAVLQDCLLDPDPEVAAAAREALSACHGS